jgi:hypothetical protein
MTDIGAVSVRVLRVGDRCGDVADKVRFMSVALLVSLRKVKSIDALVALLGINAEGPCSTTILRFTAD